MQWLWDLNPRLFGSNTLPPNYSSASSYSQNLTLKQGAGPVVVTPWIYIRITGRFYIFSKKIPVPRTIPGEGNGTPLQYSCLENPMDGGAWWAADHGVAKSRTRLSDFALTFSLSCIGEGDGNPLQCSCLENPRGRRAWWADVYGVTQSMTRLK